MNKTVSAVAKNAILAHTMLTQAKTVVKDAALDFTMINQVKVVVKNAIPANTITKRIKRRNRMLAKTTAMLDRI
jgi:hypothetical protein